MWRLRRGSESDRETGSATEPMPWPRLVVFAIPLRDPLPLPHGVTFTRVLDAEVDGLEPVEFMVEDDEATPRIMVGPGEGQVVSLKIWQHPYEALGEEYGHLARATAVLARITGDSRRVALPPQNEDEDNYRTVVEAVTIVDSMDQMAMTDEQTDPLSRCLHTLFDLVRAYRLVGQTQISELTYERVVPFVPYRWRRISPPEFLGATQFLVLDHMNVSTPAPDVLSEVAMQTYAQHLERLLAQNPFTLYAERRLESRIAHERDGQYAESAIQSAIAAEVLLDGLLGVLLWEEQRGNENVAEAVEIFSSSAATRVRSFYHPRLGGAWSIIEDGPIRRWFIETAGLRNRVVHRGYRPSRSESAASIDALGALEKHLCDLLAARSKRYPRAALAMLGADGLRRRDEWDDRRFSSASIGDILDGMRGYRDWRSRVDDVVHLRRTT